MVGLERLVFQLCNVRERCDMRRFNIAGTTVDQDACGILSEEDDVKLISWRHGALDFDQAGPFAPQDFGQSERMQGATEITYDPTSGLRVGGLASIYDVESAPAVRQHYPLLAQACHVVANIRIRNMATIGGNLAHADYQSDPPAALVALNASVELTNRSRVRKVKLADFLLGSYETSLEPDELLTALLVPAPSSDTRCTYIKFTTRSPRIVPARESLRWCGGRTVSAKRRGSSWELFHRLLLFVSRSRSFGGIKLTSDLIREIAQEAGNWLTPSMICAVP